MKIDKTLLLIQKKLIDDFETINNIFAIQNIKWWAHSGTLLGAVREGGLIKWDDDIDMAMSFETFSQNKTKIMKILEEMDYVLEHFSIDSNKSIIAHIYPKNPIYVSGKKRYPFIDIMITVPESKRIPALSMIFPIFTSFHFKNDWRRLFIPKWLVHRAVNKKYAKALKSDNPIQYKYDQWAYKRVSYDTTKLVKIDFEGTKIYVNADYLQELNIWFGKDWRTPKVNSWQKKNKWVN